MSKKETADVRTPPSNVVSLRPFGVFGLCTRIPEGVFGNQEMVCTHVEKEAKGVKRPNIVEINYKLAARKAWIVEGRSA